MAVPAPTNSGTLGAPDAPASGAPKRPLNRVEALVVNSFQKDKRPRPNSRDEARAEAALLPLEYRPRFIRPHRIPPPPNIYTRLLEDMRNRPNILNPDSPLASDSRMKRTENRDSPEELVTKLTSSIHFYKFVPYLFLARARIYIRLNQALLAIGDCVRAIKLCEIMTGRTTIVLRGQGDFLAKALSQNARYVRQNFDAESEEAAAAANITKMAEEAGIALIEACVMLPVNPDSVGNVLRPVFEMTADAEGGGFENGTYTEWYDEYLGALMADEQATAEREEIRKLGPECTAMIEHFNQKVNYIEYNRGHYGLSTVWEFLKGKVDTSLIVCPQQSKMIPWEEGEGEGQDNTDRGKEPVRVPLLPQNDPQLRSENDPEVRREKAEAKALVKANQIGVVSKPFGMILPTDVPANCKLSHDKTNLVVQDTGNFAPPYYCERCWVQVTTFNPSAGLVCCYHALKSPTEPYAPTIYCSPRCQLADQERHTRFHRAQITSAYECAAAGNDFPLFVAKCVNTAEGPGVHPLTLGAVSVTLEQFGPNTRYLFSIQNDLIAPWNTLLDLGYNIFSDRKYDTWVLISLKHKWANNKRVKLGGKLSMMFPIRAFYNHSCESNAIVGMPFYKGKNKVLIKASEMEKDRPVNEEIVFAKRDIQQGEEVTISYIGNRVSKLKKKQRVKALRKVGIDFCQCTLCKREREEEEERQERRSWLF